MKWSHLAHVLCRNLLKSNPTDCRPLSESFVQIQAGKSEISVGEIAGVVITTVDCRTPGAVAVSRSRVCYSANEGQVDDAKDHPVPPPHSHHFKSLPSSFGDDHLGANLVKLHPQVFILKPNLDVLVEAGSRVLGSV